MKEILLPHHEIKTEAERLGFSACGISPAKPVDEIHAKYFRQWLSDGCQAGMTYMENHEDLRLDPQKLFPGCRSVVCVALNYYPPQTLPEDTLQMAWYAYGKDYHDVMRTKLQSLLLRLQEQYGTTLTGRICCDTAPILERYWAWHSGIGWIGRHTQLVIPHQGSAFFLGELLLNIPTDFYDSPIPSHCGNCTRCMDACPTHAICNDKGLDARRCLSYLTIEHRGELPSDVTPHLYPYFYGCDRCLKACPHLSGANPTEESTFHPSPELLSMQTEDWMQLDIEHYRRLFKRSAVKRAKFESLQRNLQALSGVKKV